jgi:hypothetical protein
MTYKLVLTVFSFVLTLHSFVLAITEYITLIKNANKKIVKKRDLVSKFLLSRNPMVRSKFNFDVWFQSMLHVTDVINFVFFCTHALQPPL